MKLTVIGAYLPRLTPERLTAWVSDDVKEFVREIRELQERGLATSWSEADIETRANELPDELTASLNSAALFEIGVRDHDGTFDPNEIFEERDVFIPNEHLKNRSKLGPCVQHRSGKRWNSRLLMWARWHVQSTMHK